MQKVLVEKKEQKESWNPHLTDLPHPIPTYKLLRNAVWKLYRKNIISNPCEVLKDNYGIYGYRYHQFILVAKREIYGNIVSVHEEAVLKARIKRIRIVMWLDSAKKFYAFDPEEIDKAGKRNYKGMTPMLNFNIYMGKAVNW